jgi:hypothetical protein
MLFNHQQKLYRHVQKKHLAGPKCDQKSEAGEAAEYRIYDVKMTLIRFKNAG